MCRIWVFVDAYVRFINRDETRYWILSMALYNFAPQKENQKNYFRTHFPDSNKFSIHAFSSTHYVCVCVFFFCIWIVWKVYIMRRENFIVCFFFCSRIHAVHFNWADTISLCHANFFASAILWLCKVHSFYAFNTQNAFVCVFVCVYLFNSRSIFSLLT